MSWSIRRLDILVANAGVSKAAMIEETKISTVCSRSIARHHDPDTDVDDADAEPRGSMLAADTGAADDIRAATNAVYSAIEREGMMSRSPALSS
jgi:hypothetical protein